jgi:endonuclease III
LVRYALEAVMHAPVEEVVACIRCRGMHHMLANRIQSLLRRVHRERGCLSLEFLHNCPTELARGYLLSLQVGTMAQAKYTWPNVSVY